MVRESARREEKHLPAANIFIFRSRRFGVVRGPGGRIPGKVERNYITDVSGLVSTVSVGGQGGKDTWTAGVPWDDGRDAVAGGWLTRAYHRCLHAECGCRCWTSHREIVLHTVVLSFRRKLAGVDPQRTLSMLLPLTVPVRNAVNGLDAS